MEDEETYLKERDVAATQAIDESMMRKRGQSMPTNGEQINPVRYGHTDSGYSPLKW